MYQWSFEKNFVRQSIRPLIESIFLCNIISPVFSQEVRQMPLDEVVIYDADTKKMEINGDDFRNFPSQVSSRLKRKLQRIDRAFQNDYVSRLFLKALADLIGGYRDALKYTETKEVRTNFQKIDTLDDCSGIRTRIHLVRKRTLNHSGQFG